MIYKITAAGAELVSTDEREEATMMFVIETRGESNVKQGGIVRTS